MVTRTVSKEISISKSEIRDEIGGFAATHTLSGARISDGVVERGCCRGVGVPANKALIAFAHDPRLPASDGHGQWL